MASITKTNQAGTPDDKKKKKKRIIIGATLGLATVGVVVGAVLGAKGCSDTTSKSDFGVEYIEQDKSEHIEITIPTGTKNVKGYIWHEENNITFNADTAKAMKLNGSTLKLNEEKYGYRMNHQEIIADDQGVGHGELSIDVYTKGQAPAANDLSNEAADKASSDEAFDVPVAAKPLFTKKININVSFIAQDIATKNIGSQLSGDTFSFPVGSTKAPIKAPFTIPTDGTKSAPKALTPELGASLGLDIPVGATLPTYTVKSDGGDNTVGTMTITNDGVDTTVKITSGITSTKVTTPKAPAKTPEEIANEAAAAKAAEEKAKQDATKAAADKAKQDAADKLAAAANAKDAAKQADQNKLKALPVPTGFPTATDTTLPDYIAAKDEFDNALADFKTAQANGDLDKAQEALTKAKDATQEANAAIAKAQQVKDNLDHELSLVTPPKAPGVPTGTPTAEYTKAKADYDKALADFNAKKAAFDLAGTKAAKTTAEAATDTANKHLSADPAVVFAALGTMEALPTNMPSPVPADIQNLVDEYNAADTDFNTLLATPTMAGVDQATQDLKTGRDRVAAIKKLIADDAAIAALATPKAFPVALKTLPAGFADEETKYNAAKTAFDAAVAAKDPVEANKQLLLLNAASDKATLLNEHVTEAITKLGSAPTLPASTGKAGNERDEYNTAKANYATAKAAFDAAVAADDLAGATTALANIEAAVKLASSNLDPKNMSITVYVYDGTEYKTHDLALAAAKTGEEAKITEKTIYKLGGTAYDTQVEAEDALKTAADATIKTQTWAAGTAPADGSAAPAATTQDTVYVFNGRAFETEAKAQAAWLAANPGSPEVEGSFDVMYEGTKVKSFTIGSADKDKYKDEASALADAKSKFTYVKGGTTGAAAVSEVDPTPVSTPTVADGDVVKVDGTDYLGKTTPEDLNGAKKMTYADLPSGATNMNLDGVDQTYISEKPLGVDPKGVALFENGKVNKYATLDDVLDGEGVDGFMFVTEESSQGPVISTWMSEDLKQKAIDDLTAIGGLGILKRDKDFYGDPFKEYLAAYKKFLTDVALPVIYGTLKISGSTIKESDALDISKIDGTVKELKDIMDKVISQLGSPVTKNMFMPEEQSMDLQKAGHLSSIFKLMLGSIAALPKGEGTYIGNSMLGDVDLKSITDKLIDGLKNEKLLNADLLLSPLNLIAGQKPVPSYDGGSLAPGMFAHSPIFMTPASKALKIGISAHTFHGVSLVDSNALPMHIGNVEGMFYKPVSFETTVFGHMFKTSDIDISVNQADGGHNFIFETGTKTQATGTKIDKTDVFYKLADGTYITDKTKIPGYKPAVLKLTKKTDNSDFSLPSSLYLRDGKSLSDNDFVTDKTKAEGYVAPVPESRIDKYKLQFDGTEITGKVEEVHWTTSTAPAAPILDETKVSIDKFKAYVPDTTNTLSDVPSSAITSEAITAGFDSVKTAGDKGVDESTLTKTSGGFSGVVMDGKFYTDKAAAEAAYKVAHSSDITTEQIKTMFDGKDLKTEADAIKAADAKAVTLVTDKTKDVPYVATSDEPDMDTTIDSVVIYA